MCTNLLAHEDLGQFKEAHPWNLQAKFYNVKFPLVYESDNIWDSLYEEHGATLKHNIWDLLYHGATLKHKCGKRIVALPLFICFLFFWAFFGLSLFLGQCSIEWWSSHFYLFTTQWLQLDTKTKYDSIWMPPAVYRDMQWIMSDKYERIMNSGFATNTMSTTWSC